MPSWEDMTSGEKQNRESIDDQRMREALSNENTQDAASNAENGVVPKVIAGGVVAGGVLGALGEKAGEIAEFFGL